MAQVRINRQTHKQTQGWLGANDAACVFSESLMFGWMSQWCLRC